MKHQKTELLEDLQSRLGKYRGRKQYMKIVRRQDRSIHRERAVKTDVPLLASFYWGQSPEGHCYWEEIEQLKHRKTRT